MARRGAAAATQRAAATAPATERGELDVATLVGMAAPYNPRKIGADDLAALRRSITHFGFVEPVVVNRRLGRIVGGHQRVLAAAAENIATLPVVFVELDEAGERQLNLALNRIAGVWDEDKLAETLAELVKLNADLSLTGFSSVELDDLLAALKKGLDESDPTPEPPANPITKLGDLWRLGDHRLLCGDSSRADNIRMVCEDAGVVATLTDPPYGVDYQSKAEKLGSSGSEHYIEAEGSAGLAFLAHAPGDVLIMSYPIDVHFFQLADAFRSAGWLFRRELIWCKNRAAPSLGSKFSQQHEPILVCSRKGAKRLRLYMDHGTPTVFHVDMIQKHDRHPTEKPLELWDPLVEMCSRRGEHVFEPFSGSGTTIAACDRAGRIAHAIELAPGFCDVAVQRWEEQSGGKAERVPGA